MRDPNRIPKILDKIKKIWENHPDMRLFQLLLNPFEVSPYLYHIEDDNLLEYLEETYLKK